MCPPSRLHLPPVFASPSPICRSNLWHCESSSVHRTVPRSVIFLRQALCLPFPNLESALTFLSFRIDLRPGNLCCAGGIKPPLFPTPVLCIFPLFSAAPALSAGLIPPILCFFPHPPPFFCDYKNVFLKPCPHPLGRSYIPPSPMAGAYSHTGVYFFSWRFCGAKAWAFLLKTHFLFLNFFISCPACYGPQLSRPNSTALGESSPGRSFDIQKM